MVNNPVSINKEALYRCSVLGQKIKNRTRRYLFPLLLLDNKYLKKVLEEYTIACAIKYKEKEGNVFLVLNAPKYQDIMKLREHKDYVSDDYLYAPFHIVEIKVPFKNVYDKFIEGKYSEMFTQKEIDQYYTELRTKLILSKNEIYRRKLEDMLQTEIKGELDSKIEWKYESIN